MTDAISNYGRRAQSDASLRSALDKTDRKAGALSQALADVSTTAPASKAPGADQVQLSNVAARAMAEPDFDRVKVESIKQAIQDGQYPLNARKIAESFHAIEQMIRE
jgi:negative regulator of flagellin synthesis FlgM